MRERGTDGNVTLSTTSSNQREIVLGGNAAELESCGKYHGPGFRLTRCSRLVGDPSLRLKNGSARDDALNRIQIEPLKEKRPGLIQGVLLITESSRLKA